MLAGDIPWAGQIQVWMPEDIHSGASDSNPSGFVEYRGSVFFGACIAHYFSQDSLWKTDGTSSGTIRVGNEHGSDFSLYPYPIGVLNGVLLFSAENGHGFGLWRTDGTKAGTFRVKQVRMGRCAFLGGAMYFVSGTAIWKTNGTARGTFKVKDFSSQGPVSPVNPCAFNGALYFALEDIQSDSVACGWNLWTSNGTAAGTRMFKDIGASEKLDHFFVFSDKLYFTASGPVGSTQTLWMTDGTAAGTVIVKEEFSYCDHAVLNGSLYLVAHLPGKIELWKSDGTGAGTVLLKTMEPGTDSFDGHYESESTSLVVLGDKLYFPSADPDHGFELWTSDGTADGTVMVKDINPAGSSLSWHTEITTYHGLLFFGAMAGGANHDEELWVSDGTPDNTWPLRDVCLATYLHPSYVTNVGDWLAFSADDGLHGDELVMLSRTIPADATPPAAAVAGPADGGTVDRDVLNARKYLEVTFTDPAGIKATSITDAAPELTLSGTGATGVRLGAPKRVTGATYRYAFAGTFSEGPVNAEFTQGAFTDNAGNANAAATESFTVTADASKPTVALANPADSATADPDILNGRRWIEVTFSDAAALNASTITDAAPELTLSGAGAAGVTLGSPKRLSGNTYRYAFTGSFVPGDVTVSIVPASFADLAGNVNDAAARGFTLAAPQGQRFGATGGKAGVVLTKTDADGTAVKFRMTGPGFGEVTEQDGKWVLNLYSTTSASAVTLATTKSRDPQDDGEADLFGITLNAPLRSLTGRTTNLKGPVNVSSLLGTLTLDDVTGGSLNFTGARNVAGTPTLVFDQVSDLAIASPETPLKAITATEWLDADNIGISAPWVGTLTIKGRAGAALQQLAGDFAADLTLTGHDSKGRSLGTLSVAGAILTGDMTLSGAAGAISATSWSGGTLTALSVGTLAVKDSLAHVTVTLSQRRDLAVKALERLTVGRWIDTSTITTVGNIGTVVVGGMKGCTLRAGEAPLDFASLLLAALDEMTVEGIADQPYSFINSNISAWTMGTISVVHVQTVNTGANPPEFGINAFTIKSYSRDQRRYDGYYSWYPRDEADDYHVYVWDL